MLSRCDNEYLNKQDFTLTHIESQLNATLGLNSPNEYKFWLLTYARYLIENNYEDKLVDLCNFLLGSNYSIKNQPYIMVFCANIFLSFFFLNFSILCVISFSKSFKKRDLLENILEIMSQNLRFQRLYTFYNQQLKSDDPNKGGSMLRRFITANNVREDESHQRVQKLMDQRKVSTEPIVPQEKQQQEIVVEPIREEADVAMEIPEASPGLNEMPTMSVNEQDVEPAQLVG